MSGNFLSDFLSRVLGFNPGQNNSGIQMSMGPGGTLSMTIVDPATEAALGGQRLAGARSGRQAAQPGNGAPTSARSALRQLSERLNSTTAFLPQPTSQRWSDEARLHEGPMPQGERNARLANHIINALISTARAAREESRRKADEERKEKASTVAMSEDKPEPSREPATPGEAGARRTEALD